MENSSYILEFLNFGIIDILGQKIPYMNGILCWGVFSNIAGP